MAHLKSTKVEKSKSLETVNSNMEKEKNEMMERRFAVQYRVKTLLGYKWINFTDYVSEADAKEKAQKISHLGVTRVVTMWLD